MWFVYDENGNCVGCYEYEWIARGVARRVNGRAVWDC